ncbi:uncharacterized protein LOC130416212 [Triplophysa dalaica]|uniref:uncharacterized protein LOC130416212 n=1 Tax=Triplophysa dalaica TaxID=1582913 RepID=UPI0024DF5A64|nr:uncharacterized protein LOC130416212 [Triplophysa dalaica]
MVTRKELRLSPVDAPAVPALKTPVPLPKELMFLVHEPSASTQSKKGVSATEGSISRACRTLSFEESNKDEPCSSAPPPSVCVPPPVRPTAQSTPTLPRVPAPQLPGYDNDTRQWKCSHQQRIWMKTELESMGLWPGSPPVSNPMKTVSLWRLPPQPELIDTVSDLPSAKYFQLHPFFIWKPENDTLMARLKSNYALPCIAGCSKAQVTCAGVGRPRVIVGITGQYYLFSSRLCCKVCKKRWYADNPQWLEKLPKRFTNVLPAIITYKKAICRSVQISILRLKGCSECPSMLPF